MSSNINRQRISSNLLGAKILFGIFAIGGLTSIIKNWENQSFLNIIIALSGTTTIIGGILFYIFTRKQIDFDDIQSRLFIVDVRNNSEEEIPLSQIDKIMYSAIGLTLVHYSSYSYVIIYRDFHNVRKKVRLFPKAFSNDVDRLIDATKSENPNLQTRNWSIGWNELFD